MQTKVRSLFLILNLIGFSLLSPINEDEAKLAAGATGVAAGFVVGGITYNALTDGMQQQSNTADGFITGSVAVGVGALLGWLAYKFFKRFTPRGRYERAKSIIDELSSDSLIYGIYELPDHKLIERVNSVVGGAWPLAVAVERYDSYKLKLGAAFGLIEASRKGVKVDSKIYNDCNDLENKAHVIFSIIEKMENIIRNSNDYRLQNQGYQKHKIEVAKMEQERREKEKDRRQKQSMHWDKMNNKNKDRKLKESFLNKQNNRNVNVNVNI